MPSGSNSRFCEKLRQRLSGDDLDDPPGVLMPDWQYSHLLPGSNFSGLLAKCGISIGQRLGRVSIRSLVARPCPDVWVSRWRIVRLAGLPLGVFSSAELRDVLRDRVVDRELALVLQHHDRRRR